MTKTEKLQKHIKRLRAEVRKLKKALAPISDPGIKQMLRDMVRDSK